MRLELVAGDITLGAFVIDGVIRRPLLIKGKILRRLRHRHIECIDDVRAIDPALPEEAELDKFEATLYAPLQCRQASRHPNLPSNGYR